MKLSGIFRWMKLSLRAMYGVDPEAMVVCRIATGLVVLLDLLSRMGVLHSFGIEDLIIFYTDQGINLRQHALQYQQPSWSIFMASGVLSLTLPLFLVGVVASVCLCLGIKSHLSAGVCLLIIQGAVFRCHDSMMGADYVLTRALFFMALDPYLPLESDKVEELSDHAQGSQSKQHREVLCVGGFGLLSLQGLLYIGAAITKSKKAWLEDAIMLKDSVRSPVYGPVWPMVWLRQLPDEALAFLTRSAVWIELLAGVLILAPVVKVKACRILAFVLVFFLQSGINIVLHLGLFGPICIATALPLIPSGVVDMLKPKRTSQNRRKGPIGAKVPLNVTNNDGVAAPGVDERATCEATPEVTPEVTSSSVGHPTTQAGDKPGFDLENLLRVLICSAGALFMVYTTLPLFCRDNGSLGCHIPEVVRTLPAVPSGSVRIASAFGLTPFAFNMFDVQTISQGWLTIVGQTPNGTTFLLPTWQETTTAAQTYKRPPPNWFPSMRWRQYWFQWVKASNKSVSHRESAMRYFCTNPPREDYKLNRIQIYYTEHMLKNWTEPSEYADFPSLKPRRILHWFCTMELFNLWKAGKYKDDGIFLTG